MKQQIINENTKHGQGQGHDKQPNKKEYHWLDKQPSTPQKSGSTMMSYWIRNSHSFSFHCPWPRRIRVHWRPTLASFLPRSSWSCQNTTWRKMDQVTCKCSVDSDTFKLTVATLGSCRQPRSWMECNLRTFYWADNSWVWPATSLQLCRWLFQAHRLF